MSYKKINEWICVKKKKQLGYYTTCLKFFKKFQEFDWFKKSKLCIFYV